MKLHPQSGQQPGRKRVANNDAYVACMPYVCAARFFFQVSAAQLLATLLDPKKSLDTKPYTPKVVRALTGCLKDKSPAVRKGMPLHGYILFDNARSLLGKRGWHPASVPVHLNVHFVTKCQDLFTNVSSRPGPAACATALSYIVKVASDKTMDRLIEELCAMVLASEGASGASHVGTLKAAGVRCLLTMPCLCEM
jgi:hypothetical protein